MARLTQEKCLELLGEHCYKRGSMVLASNPPQYPEYCKHCGAYRVAIPQEPFTYRYPRDDG